MEKSSPILIPNPRTNDPEEELGVTPPDAEIITTLEDGLTLDSPSLTGGVVPKVKPGVYATLPTSSYSMLLKYQAPQVKEVLKACFPEPIRKIVDTTAHVGGDSILFADTFPMATITAIDCDPEAIRCLLYNINNFSDPSRFIILLTNSAEWIRKQVEESRIDEADFYYLDPPWSGPRYYSKREIHLTLDNTPVVDVINNIFTLGLTTKVLLKVPRNFAYPSFKSTVRGVCKLFYIKKPQKNGSIAYGLILITKE